MTRKRAQAKPAKLPVYRDEDGNLRACQHGEYHPIFTCISSHHRGTRLTPSCRGNDDVLELRHLMGPVAYERMIHRGEDYGWCDDCWCKTMRNYIEKRVRDFKRYRKHSQYRTVREYRDHLWLRGTWLSEQALEKLRRRQA